MTLEGTPYFAQHYHYQGMNNMRNYMSSAPKNSATLSLSFQEIPRALQYIICWHASPISLIASRNDEPTKLYTGFLQRTKSFTPCQCLNNHITNAMVDQQNVANKINIQRRCIQPSHLPIIYPSFLKSNISYNSIVIYSTKNERSTKKIFFSLDRSIH